MSIYPPTGTLEIKNATLKIPVIDLQYTSNTAKIEANSNVVTEFPRSKKLIKYPRVALTSGQSGLSGGYTQDEYTVEASSELTESGVLFAASNAFNSIQAYQSTDYAWSSGANRYGTGGLATNGTSKDTFQGIDGSWIGLTLPNAIRLDHIHLYNRAENTVHVCPAKSGIIWASNDGTLWYRILSFDNLQKTDGALNVLQVNSANFYTRYRVQITANNPDPVKTAVMIGELEFYGTPEYDPEAHGTDVVVKSVPNVPNTDWLEVYYDAKNYSGSGDVQDETANNRDAEMNATFDNGEIKAFSFSGADTSNVTTSDHGLGTGDVTYTMSYWFKRTAVAGSYDYIVQLGNGGVAYSSVLMWINNNQLTLDHWSAALRVLDPIILDTWYHVAAGHSGGDTPSLENDFIYINGKKVTPEITQIAAPFTLAGSKLTLGSGVGGRTEGSIANFRLFNRALTSDEIYQLYAYQKEYFGHGDLSMTLKAGRLGIGTSEPRAALDVRGDVNVEGRVLSGHASGGTESVVDGYKIHTFTTSSNFNVVTPGVVEYLIIGGGGGGGGTHGGGGGGGGFIQGHALVKSGSHSIVVGGGGTGSTAQGANGVNSTAFGLTAVGGGGGGRGYDANTSSAGNIGGSSGGSGPFVLTGSDSRDFGKVPEKTYTNRYQGNGGGGGNNTGGAGHGGGGGGAGGPGGNATTTSDYYAGNGISGAGGSGLVSYITGSPVIYAGGGSGGRWSGSQSINVQGGVGGTNGGGGIGGAIGASGMAATAGGINTGGGGGGGSDNGGRGGNGGSGIVVLRYPV